MSKPAGSFIPGGENVACRRKAEQRFHNPRSANAEGRKEWPLENPLSQFLHLRTADVEQMIVTWPVDFLPS